MTARFHKRGEPPTAARPDHTHLHSAMTDFAGHNRKAWDRELKLGNPATVPYSFETIEAARCGRIGLSLTGRRTIPES